MNKKTKLPYFVYLFIKKKPSLIQVSLYCPAFTFAKSARQLYFFYSKNKPNAIELKWKMYTVVKNTLFVKHTVFTK